MSTFVAAERDIWKIARGEKHTRINILVLVFINILPASARGTSFFLTWETREFVSKLILFGKG